METLLGIGTMLMSRVTQAAAARTPAPGYLPG